MVVFFDGVCGLCNGFVDAIMKLDTSGAIRFSPLQSEYAKSVLPPEYSETMGTIVVMLDDNFHLKSDGVLAVLKQLGAPDGILEMLSKIPKALRDKVYDFVASNRYEWFGKKETCRIPKEEERQRFLMETPKDAQP